MEIYGFGTAPKAKAAGYKMVGTVHSTVDGLTAKYASEDVIFVYGATVHGQPGVHEFARFERQRTRGKCASSSPVSAVRNSERHLAVALEDLQRRVSEGQEYPDAEWAAARKHGVDCTALRAAYDGADAAYSRHSQPDKGTALPVDGALQQPGGNRA